MGIGDRKTQRTRIHPRGRTSPRRLRTRGYLSVVDVPNASVNQDKAVTGASPIGSLTQGNPLTSASWPADLWKHLFGEGIVRAVDDFGKTGQRPDDPRLLDYLATRIVANEWSVKKTIREIVASRLISLPVSQTTRTSRH